MNEDHVQTDFSRDQRDAARREQDLIQEMSERLDAMWWFDRHMAEGGWTPELNTTWRRLKDEEHKASEQMKDFIVTRMHADCVA